MHEKRVVLRERESRGELLFIAWCQKLGFGHIDRCYQGTVVIRGIPNCRFGISPRTGILGPDICKLLWHSRPKGN